MAVRTKISVIIPVNKINDYLRKDVIPSLQGQSYQDFELVIIPDKLESKERFPSFVKIFASWPKTGPSDKRNLGVSYSRGKVVAFIDDDAYPGGDWLKNASGYFENEKIAAVCGPGVTPANDPFLAQISGWMWSSFLGAAGAGTYRCRVDKKREVDDYPTFNLMVRKSDFQNAGGFDSRFWPGEDTKLCHDLVYKLGKKIIYDPKILVYHHRRKIFLPHLKQIGGYGLHRGYFAKILPKTSRRLGYFLPSLFTLGLIIGPALFLILRFLNLSAIACLATEFYLLATLAYFSLLLINSILVLSESGSLLLSFLLMPTIFLSHFYYGLMFLWGIFSSDLKDAR